MAKENLRHFAFTDDHCSHDWIISIEDQLLWFFDDFPWLYKMINTGIT